MKARVIGETLYVTGRDQWRRWLEKNFEIEKEIWLILPARETGQTRILYNDAVEEALSFGWIDSTVKRWDENSTVQRFSPRRPGSEYSQANKERLKKLLEEGKVHPSIKKSVEDVLKQVFVFPADIIEALKGNPRAWANFEKFSPAYQRIRIAYINGARNRPVEFKKRLENFIKQTERNKIIGYGGIEKYY